MMGSLKKPHRMTIKKHVSCCETMNGYISILPTLQDSSLAAASTEKGNVPFNDSALASIVLATCHISWRNLYKLNHKTVPGSMRLMLHDLETIKKIFIERNNKKAKAGIAKAGTAPQKGLSVPHKKGKGGSSGGPAPKKACTAKYCKHCQAVGGLYQTHNTSECCRFDKDGKETGKSHKPFDPTKKPWKKGGGDLGQMAYLTKKLEKLEKKLKKSKSKKSSMKRARDSSSSSSDSD
jgi:hypothetical protein